MTHEESIAERMARIRKERNLTAKSVAVAVGAAESTYREWENGRGMRLPPFQKISQVLAISVTELVTGEKPELSDVLEELKRAEDILRELRLKLGARI